MSASTIDYSRRAGANPEPAGWVHDWSDAHTPDDAAAWASGEHPMAAGVPHSFWADISEFQSVITSAYPYQQLCIRLDTGYRLDNHAAANRSAWLRMKRSGPLMGYPVFIPGQARAALGRMRNTFGAQLEGIAPMVDMESGQGFAGPGNHSNEANDFVNELAAATGSIEREIGYANGGDWANNWPSRGALRHRILANYGSTMMSGYFAQQYYGGLNYPVPAGFPRSCAPFGSWVDLNAAATTTAGLIAALGFTSTDPLEDVMAMYASKAEYEAAMFKVAEKAVAAFLVSGQDGKQYGFETIVDRAVASQLEAYGFKKPVKP